jgi:uncharacterized protein
MSLRKLSWSEYNTLVRVLVDYVRAISFQPDAIVGIARGGLPLLTTLASALGVRDVGVVFMQNTLSDNAFPDRPAVAVCRGVAIPFAIDNKSILLVDDILRSGQSAAKSILELQKLGASAIKIVTLYKQDEDYSFEYYSSERVDKSAWIIFPWDDLLSDQS